jgi:lysophospholipase L1-like esterase
MKRALTIFLTILTAGITATAQTQPFKTGDRIAFVGNSITEQGYYESYVWLYYMLHFPHRRITIFNRGIGGDVAKQMYERFDDDVLPADPTVICLTFGMNDTGYYEFLASNADSTANVRVNQSHHYFELLEQKLKALPNVRNIMIAGSLYDETVKIKGNYFPGKSKYMEKIVDFQEQAAKDNHWGWVDFFHPMTAITLEQQKTDTAFTLTGNDRIHPGNAGHFVMAYLFLKAQGLDTLPVADMSIDAVRLHADRVANCRITNLTALTGEKGSPGSANEKVSPGSVNGSAANGLRFDYLASSLPFPVDTVPRLWGNPHRQSEAIGLIPFYSSFNRETLCITNLAQGTYQLTIDDRPIAQYTAADLDRGINLAKLTNTPEYEQAMSVLQLNEERMAFESKSRAYYWLQFDYLRDLGLKFKDSEAAMDSVNAASSKNWAVATKRDNYRAARYPAVRAAWQKEMDLLINEIYAMNQPKTHLIEIKKISE